MHIRKVRLVTAFDSRLTIPSTQCPHLLGPIPCPAHTYSIHLCLVVPDVNIWVAKSLVHGDPLLRVNVQHATEEVFGFLGCREEVEVRKVIEVEAVCDMR